jgi:nucleotide-binding universal stress UspA family protein
MTEQATRPIVVGYDGRAGSQAALREALRLARGLRTTIVLVFSFEATPLGGERADLDTAIRERAQAVLAEGLHTVTSSGVQASTEYAELSPAEGLVTAADEHDAEMIVVGSTGEGPLRGMLVGSTPYKLLHHSRRPVLVVRAEE